jgi:hypothetical protein
MTPVEKLREFGDVTASVPQPAPEPHQQQGLLDRVGQLEQALAASERREHALRWAQAKLRQAHARQKSLNAALVESTSWRLTAPLRSAIDACRTLGARLRKAVRQGVAASPEAAAFHRDGFIAPVGLLTPAQCERQRGDMLRKALRDDALHVLGSLGNPAICLIFCAIGATVAALKDGVL